MFYEQLKADIEALLFVSGEPLAARKLAEILEIDVLNVQELIAQLKDEMDDSKRGLTIIAVAGGYQLCTKPELSSTVEKLSRIEESRLSVPAMETLSIIAFRQPITKQEIENIRGVKVDSVINRLLERTLIEEVGRRNVIGRPILYGTTNEFLKCFGLPNIDALPELPELSETASADIQLPQV